MGMEQGFTLAIRLEHEDGNIRAQRWLKGFVTIDVHEEDLRLDENENQMNTVKVELVGQEVTQVPSEHKRTVDIFHEESTRRIMVPKLEANCQYRFPFSIYAPGSVAPSMQYVDAQAKGISCHIEYLLKASFHAVQTEKKIHMVGQPLSSKAHPATVEPSVVPVVTSSFSWKNMESTKHRCRRQVSCEEEKHHHGCLVWAAKVQNTHVGKGEEATFSFSLRNHSSYDVIKLSARLVEKVSWKTESETRSHQAELGYALMPNLAFFRHQPSTLSRHQAQLVPVDHALDQDMHKELGLQEHLVTIKIPSRCRDSYKGRLIQVTHSLLIEARTGDTHGKDHTAVMTLELPLKVFDPPVVDHHHHHSQNFDFANPAEVAEKVMTKWPAGEDEMQASFTSIDDTSWDTFSDAAVCVAQIREE